MNTPPIGSAFGDAKPKDHARALLAAIAKEREAWAKLEDARMDERIAKRGGGDGAAEAKIGDAIRSEWSNHYQDCRSHARALLSAHGIEPREIGRYI